MKRGDFMSMIGVDISEHNGVINFDTLVKNINFVIIRIGYGVSYLPDKQKDKYFEKNYAGLHGRIPVGIYYYSYAKKIGDGKKEAQNCLKYLDGRDLDLPIFYDVEDNSMGCINEVTREFVDVIRSAGYTPGVYTYKNWLDTGKLDQTKFGDCVKWFAAYGQNNGGFSGTCPSGADIWQYTSRALYPGIHGNVDANLSYINFGGKEKKVDYYDEAWKRAKELGIVSSSKPTEKPDKGWIIYILYKLGVIK